MELLMACWAEHSLVQVPFLIDISFPSVVEGNLNVEIPAPAVKRRMGRGRGGREPTPDFSDQIC